MLDGYHIEYNLIWAWVGGLNFHWEDINENIWAPLMLRETRCQSDSDARAHWEYKEHTSIDIFVAAVQ